MASKVDPKQSSSSSAESQASKSTRFGQSLRNHFLIAMPSLSDPNFAQTITYICDHGPDGAMGLIVNRPMDIQLADVFEQMDIHYTAETGDGPILEGGPVSKQRGFILHPTGGEWQSSVAIGPEISLTASRDIISAIASGDGPDSPQFVLGYAGWGAGQLEDEIKENSWLTLEADADLLFNTPIEQRWHAISNRLGVDINLIPSRPGHA